MACGTLTTVASSHRAGSHILPFVNLFLGQFIWKCKRSSSHNNRRREIKIFQFNVQGVPKDFDEVVYRRMHPLIWREEFNNASVNDIVPPKCRNSIQGKTLLVDDEGYVCPRIELLSSGCCKVTAQSKQYDCDSCIDDGCCSVYEYCVSCCLNPNKVRKFQLNQEW